MTAREVVLEGGSPWGFRMHGGVDVQQSLRISRVNPGSKAAVKGVREGDIITSINNQPTRDITNADAHLLLKNSGDTLKLGLNEDCQGSPRRRQFRTVQQQETRSESVEQSSSSKTSYSSTTTVTIKRSRPNSIDTENPPAPKPEEYTKIVRNGEPGNGVISQRSTLSSTSSSSPAASVAETQGTEARQEARDTTVIVDSKPVSADKKDVIADTSMGGNSRSHKRRSRASRKKNKPVKPVSDEMVEVPPVNDVPEPENVAENGASSAENAEVQTIAENRLLERVTNYRVESPETIKKQKRSNSNGVIKSKSLDDDDLVKITELSETSESEDNKITECSALISEADSDVEWEVTEDLQDKPSEKEECLSTTTLPLEELESVNITMISPEDEKNLRDFLEGLNLSTNPEDSSVQQKKETYKERKARKRAAIAEHFMPVLQFPRFLEVIREEGSDGSNGEAIATTERVVVVGGKLTEAVNVQGTCSTSTVQTSSAEVVYIDDSRTPSDVSDDEGDDEASKSEDSHYSSLQELSADPENGRTDTANPDMSRQETEKVLPPPSQLTPPPTPDLSTPKNETICDVNKNVISHMSNENYEHPSVSLSPCEEAFNKEFKGFCEELNLQDPCKYVNALSPTRSSSVSSESSSKTQVTARYNPMNSSIGDVADFLKDEEEKNLTSPDSLRELCLKELMSLPFGADVLEELAEVSQSIQEWTDNWQEKINPLLRKHFPAPCKQPFINTSFPLPAKKEETKWVGLPTQRDPKVLVCLSPTQKSYLESTEKVQDEAGRLLDLHEKFHTRRGYHEEVQSKNVRGLSVQQENAAKTGEFTNRLLAIIRETSDDSRRLSGEGNSSKQEENNSVGFKMQNLSEWVRLREMSTSAPSLAKAEFSTERHQKRPNGRTQGYNSNRRHSLPHEICQQQIEYIRERERELQEEIEKLEKEKRKVLAEMAAQDVEQYHISKNGDNGEKSGILPETEFFRQQMYDEYMKQVAAREERKIQKVIKITSSKTTTQEESKSLCEVQHVTGIENEFMDKVKERMLKYGLKRDDSEESVKMETKEENKEPVMLMDGDSLKDAKGLPKHLQEFVDITRQATNGEKSEETVDLTKEAINGESEGVWSPGQRPTEFKPKDESKEEKQDEPIPPVWTPRSAGSSPTAERKEFRPVSFESPVLARKNKPKQETTTPESPSVQPSWQAAEGSSDNRVAPSSLERRIPTSHSSPATGFTEFSTPRLPRAQNPTITLLQKAREGQLPRGASYIQTETHHPPRVQDDRPLIGPGEVVYQIRKDYASDDERARRMVDLRPKTYEIGIGPTTQDGMPLVLRSEVKESNQSKWYKKMYDTIHKQKPDRDYVTVRYKQRRAVRYPYSSGYFSEPEHNAFSAEFYDSDGTVSDGKYTTLDRRRAPQPTPRDKENDYMSYTIPRDTTHSEIARHGHDVYKNQPGRIENYVPGRSSISEKEAKEHLEQQKNVPQPRGYMSQALKESGYESDSTLIFRRREDAVQQLSPLEQREAYKNIQKGGDVPLHGLRKPAPERPKEAEAPTPPPKGQRGRDSSETESPRKYVENEVTIHYKTPVRQEVKESLSEEELSRRQAEHMKRVYEEERRRKYLQVSDSVNELQDMNSRRHTDNFIPSQKSPIPLNRYDDFPIDDSPKVKPRPRSPDLRLVARALYNFVGQSSRELTFRKGDVIYVRRQVDKNWYEGEHNAMVGLFPANYVEIMPYDGIKSTPRKPHEGQARAKFNFIAQTHLELSLAKGELVVVTRRVDDNWFEGRIGGRKGIFPVSYVEVLIDPGAPPPPSSKPVASPAAHSMLVNGSAGGKESMGSHSYLPSVPQQFTSSYRAKPAQVNSGGNYGSLSKSSNSLRNPLNEVLHIDTHSEPVPYRALYKYRPQNDDELELLEGDVVYVLEKCDDGWYVGSSQRTGAFGTFPGNYVERI